MIRRGRNRVISMKILFFMVILFFGMGIGYASISTSLVIDGTTDIDHSSWDIHFANVQVESGSVTADTPVITDDTSVSFSASLENPGDYYEFTVDVVNNGTMDAKLNAITITPVLTAEQQKFFSYDVSYENPFPITVGDTLFAGQTEKLHIKFQYLVSDDTSDYPTEDTSFDFSVSMNYIQGRGSIYYKYYTGDTHVFNGESMPSNVTTYDNYNDAIASIGYPIFTVQRINNNVIDMSVVGAVNNGEVHYLYGGGATFNSATEKFNDDSIYYETNRNTLFQLYGDACVETSGEESVEESNHMYGVMCDTPDGGSEYATYNGEVAFVYAFEYFCSSAVGESPSVNQQHLGKVFSYCYTNQLY